MDPNDGITARGCAEMSLEERVVVGCLNADIVKTLISSFRRVGIACSGQLPQARTVLLFGGYSGQIIPRRNLLTRRRK